MKEFTRCHPIVNLIFYISVLAFGVTLIHPVCLAVAFLGSVLVSVVAAGVKKTAATIGIALVIAVITAAFNGLFNHAGVTILWYFPSGNALTLESITFGAMSGVMLATVVVWFVSLNQVITSEKIMYLFGGILPSISLMISQVLRLVPEFIRNFKTISTARQAIGKGGENKFVKLKKTFSAFITISLENAIQTADSMKARSYSNVRRTSYINYKFTVRDVILLTFILFFAGVTLYGVISGDTKAVYFPSIAFAKITPLTVFAYILLCTTPLIFGIWEGLRWKKLK